MTIDEIIENEKEIADMLYDQQRSHSAYYHKQLAEWLEELKMYKSLSPRELVSEKQKNDRAIEYSKGFDYGFNTGYNKALDDIKEKLMQNGFIYTKHALDVFNEIAEQLKAGVTND